MRASLHHYFLFLFTLVVFLQPLSAQVSYSATLAGMETGPDGLHRCSSVEVDAVRQLNNPNVPSIQEFEEWLAPQVAAYRNNPAGRNNEILQIPVVVHILHNGEAIGTAPNITDAQVISQIDVLNEDFRRIFGSRGYNEHPDGADLEIAFVLAQTGPNGEATNGIVRRNINQDGVTVDELENSIKAATIWDATQYMNMWSVKFVAPDDNTLGYAQFPEGSGLAGLPSSGENAETDGVVMRYQSFGTSDLDDGTFLLDAPYDLGRTATHEVGHWIGLRHIWGDGLGCNLGTAPPGCSCDPDDFCDDTPNSDQANYGCPEDKTSICEDPLNPTADMVENYMDYSDDACMNIFTNDQKARARTVMTHSPRRMELTTSFGLLPANPTVFFTETNTSILEGSSCNFQEVAIEVAISQAPSANVTVDLEITGNVQAEDYELSQSQIIFPAGTSTSQTITVSVYEDVINEDLEQLILHIETVSGDNAQAGLANQSHSLFIADDDYSLSLAGRQPGITIFQEDFAAGIPSAWSIEPATGSGLTWLGGSPLNGMPQSAYLSRTDLPGSLYAYDHLSETLTQIISPSIDASLASELVLSFDYICYGEQDLLSGDLFDYGSVLISCDGGATWIPVGEPLVNQLTATSATISLPSLSDGCSDLQIAFRWENDGLVGFDPPLSIDNVILEGSVRAPVMVQEEVNTNMPANLPLGPQTEVHFFDPATGRLMMTLQNMSNHDYGCVSLAVDRSRNSSNENAVPFWNNNPENALLAKTLRIQAENPNPSGEAMVAATLYYTQAEILAWEFTTGQVRTHLEAVGVADNSMNNINPNNIGDYSVDIYSTQVATYNTSNVTLTFTITGALNIGVGAGIPNQSLPVNLNNFDAQHLTQKQVALVWTTDHEEDNAFFWVQHSTDGSRFSNIGQVQGMGYSAVPYQYEFLHAEAAEGANFYRLVQTDFDGSTETFPVVQVDLMLTKPQLSYYPNPVTDQLFVQVKGEDAGEYQIQLFDARGIQMQQHRTVAGQLLRLPVADLQSGSYYLSVTGDGYREVVPVIIQ